MPDTILRKSRRKTSASAGRDSEKVREGLSGYLRIANALAYRYYRYQLPTAEDRGQAAALAAIKAVNKLGSEGTLREVTSVIRHYLYQQSKAYGYRMINTCRSAGSRTASWTQVEMPFSLLKRLQPHGCNVATHPEGWEVAL